MSQNPNYNEILMIFEVTYHAFQYSVNILLAIVFFLSWMLFFDKAKLYTQIQLRKTAVKLEQEKDHYKDKIKIAESDRQDLEENVEKYAREKYYMHAEGEDVYLIDK